MGEAVAGERDGWRASVIASESEAIQRELVSSCEERSDVAIHGTGRTTSCRTVGSLAMTELWFERNPLTSSSELAAAGACPR